MTESVWVVGFDKNTGKKEVFTVCPKSNANFHAEVYAGKGYDVKIMTPDEVDAMLEKEKQDYID